MNTIPGIQETAPGSKEKMPFCSIFWGQHTQSRNI